MLLAQPAPHDEAARLIRGKLPATRRIFDAMQPELRAAAFVITGVEDLHAIERVRNLAAALPEGGDWDDLKGRIVEELAPWLDDDEAAERRAELLLRSHGFAAYAISNYAALEEQRDIFPWRKYQTAQDERVRGSHAALNGLILPADSPFWRDHTPPWEFGCRCDVVGLTDEDVGELRGSTLRTPEGRPAIKIVDPGPELETLEQGHLFRDGAMHFVARNPEGFQFDPEGGIVTVEMLDGLRKRVGPKVWDGFQDWARSAEMPGEGDLWAYLTKTPAIPMRRLEGPFQRVPLPRRPPVAPPRESPLSGKVEVSPDLRDGTLPGYIDHAMALVDQAHDEGGLAPVPMVRDDDPKREAHYDPSRNRIGLRIDTQYPISSTLHEVGHWLDHRAWAQEKEGRYLEGVQRRGSWSEKLVAELRKMPTLKALATETRLDDDDKGYLLDDREIFARAYVQFIAATTKDPSIKAELDGWRRENPHRVFNKREEAIIMKAMRGGLAQLGWKP